MNRFAHSAITALLLAALGSLPTVAAEPTAMKAWRFDKAIGLEGQASILNTKGDRLDAECGNGGGPALILTPAKPMPDGPERRDLTFTIDGKAHAVPFQCVDGSICITFGFPSAKTMTALRNGGALEIFQEGASIAVFPLTGSGAAISGLAPCLE